MEALELYNKLKLNIDSILSGEDYKILLNRNNNLSRYDIINRMLLCIQNDKAFDVKTDEEWELSGRIVKDKEKPVYILIPKYKSYYIDNETQEEIKNTDLSIDETVKALEYNIIEKITEIENIYTKAVYDIRQTKNDSDTEYKVDKPVLSTDIIIRLFMNITGATIELSDETYYSTSNNTLFMTRKSYKDTVATITKFFVQYYINQLDNILSNSYNKQKSDFSEEWNSLLSKSLSYSISTLLRVEKEINFSELKDMSVEDKLIIIEIVDQIIFDINSQLQFNTGQSHSDISYEITRLKKANMILNILEANEIHNKMKGA
jgi:hypothetical protein